MPGHEGTVAKKPIITLTTDFEPEAEIVDICHSVQAFDVLDGALTISQAYSYFPTGTVHMVIVDPGVGTARRPLLVTSERHHFVAPDNGVLSLVYQKEERLSARHVTGEHYFLQPVSNTFHGRDVFSPIAAYLAKGVDPAKFGEEVKDFVRFGAPKPKAVNENTLRGVVLKVDRFGNLITNITPQDACFSQRIRARSRSSSASGKSRKSRTLMRRARREKFSASWAAWDISRSPPIAGLPPNCSALAKGPM
ncbi:MAG: hypothetical protein DMG82_08515 [Acidobacteria bacterium]|nr:MAG: hypothetical protein DMG82_08515 [Acidobacteriota bacterium]